MGGEEFWYVALVDMQRSGAVPVSDEIIPVDCHGCVGWLGVLTGHESSVPDLVRETLSDVGMHAITVEEIQLLNDLEVEDDHLISNINSRPMNDPLVVWGTLHCYLAEGEA